VLERSPRLQAQALASPASVQPQREQTAVKLAQQALAQEPVSQASGRLLRAQAQLEQTMAQLAPRRSPETEPVRGPVRGPERPEQPVEPGQ